MKILILDDHSFYANEINEYLTEMGYKVFFAKNYHDGELITRKYGPFDISLLDVILQNGKTGIGFANINEDKLGRIMFITGCNDKTTVEAITNNTRYASASKQNNIWKPLKAFLNGATPKMV